MSIPKTIPANMRAEVTDAGHILHSLDEHGVPTCSERCPQHDGKRCGVTGVRPQHVCEPAVRLLVRRLEQQALTSD